MHFVHVTYLIYVSGVHELFAKHKQNLSKHYSSFRLLFVHINGVHFKKYC